MYDSLNIYFETLISLSGDGDECDFSEIYVYSTSRYWSRQISRILLSWPKPIKYWKEKEDGQDLVTIADKNTEQFIREKIHQQYPSMLYLVKKGLYTRRIAIYLGCWSYWWHKCIYFWIAFLVYCDSPLGWTTKYTNCGCVWSRTGGVVSCNGGSWRLFKPITYPS